MTAAEWRRKRANEKVLEYSGAFFLIVLVFLGVFGMIALHSSGGWAEVMRVVTGPTGAFLYGGILLVAAIGLAIGLRADRNSMFAMPDAQAEAECASNERAKLLQAELATQRRQVAERRQAERAEKATAAKTKKAEAMALKASKKAAPAAAKQSAPTT